MCYTILNWRFSVFDSSCMDCLFFLDQRLEVLFRVRERVENLIYLGETLQQAVFDFKFYEIGHRKTRMDSNINIPKGKSKPKHPKIKRVNDQTATPH
jgi:hypothetical protein